MEKEKSILILKFILGFTFVSAIDSILFLISHIILFMEIKFKFPPLFLIYSIPILTLLLYILTTLILFNKIKKKPNIKESMFENIPKIYLLFIFLIAIFLKPITNKLSGIFSENFMTDNSENYLTLGEYLSTYGSMNFGLEFSKWVVLFYLTIIIWKNLKKAELN